MILHREGRFKTNGRLTDRSHRPVSKGKPSRRFAIICGLIALAGMLALANPGWAEIGSRSTTQKMLTFAAPDPVSSSAGATRIAHAIAQSITSDLRSSGRFRAVDPSSVAANDTTASHSPGLPQFEIWRAAGVQVLVTGRIELTDEKLKAEFFVWDVATGQLIQAQAFGGLPDEWLQISHGMSSVIYERFVGQR